MADRLRNALRWLGEQKKKHESTEVTYRRRSLSIVGLLATFGTKAVDQNEIDGSATRFVYHSFVFDAADLVLQGRQVEPESGDVIVIGIGDLARTYRVSEVNGEAPWHYTDSTETRIRVLTTLHRTQERRAP
jgi:hypothetical protein